MACAFAMLSAGAEPQFLSGAATVETSNAELVRGAEGSLLRVTYHPAEYPNVLWRPGEGVWDWSGAAGLALTLENPSTEPLVVHLRIDNAGADGTQACNRAYLQIAAGDTVVWRVGLNTGAAPALWGMRGVPGVLPPAEGPVIDATKITAFQLFLNHPTVDHDLRIHDVSLVPASGAVALPFVDPYGQYVHASWPGKLLRGDELPARRDAEDAAMDARPPRPENDPYGGWTAGPHLEATGWFRVAEVDGRWWLVTPSGHLFFSLGMDCVGTWERTFVEGREGWFASLPDPHDAGYAPFFGEVSGAHSMAERIGGKGRVFSFYGANLFRKFGENWRDSWRLTSYRRLQAWGFNTLGAWAQDDVIENSPLPYTAACAVSGVPSIEGAKGYWAPMMDVFAPEFAPAVARAVEGVANANAQRPLCIGYFVDNELAWEGVCEGVLGAPETQPARAALRAFLSAKYPGIDALNAAWETRFATWESLRAPEAKNTACREDLDGFLHAFAQRYFSTIAEAVHAAAPHQLYLGCRFAASPAPVVRACGEFADVASFNLYQRTLTCGEFEALREANKPAIIGEFQFGAMDRGLFHPGISGVPTQAERAAAYAAYVRSAAACPAVVGTHWFQYVDEPLTGRYFDGENYNIGFVDVTDTPYPELVTAATAANTDIYTYRTAPTESASN